MRFHLASTATKPSASAGLSFSAAASTAPSPLLSCGKRRAARQPFSSATASASTSLSVARSRAPMHRRSASSCATTGLHRARRRRARLLVRASIAALRLLGSLAPSTRPRRRIGRILPPRAAATTPRSSGPCARHQRAVELLVHLRRRPVEGGGLAERLGGVEELHKRHRDHIERPLPGDAPRALAASPRSHRNYRTLVVRQRDEWLGRVAPELRHVSLSRIWSSEWPDMEGRTTLSALVRVRLCVDGTVDGHSVPLVPYERSTSR